MTRETLLSCGLFEGLSLSDIFTLMGCLGGRRISCGGGFVIAENNMVAIVTAGRAAPPGGAIAQKGDAFILFSGTAVPTSPRAELAVLPLSEVITICPRACAAHRKLIANLTKLLALDKHMTLEKQKAQRCTFDKQQPQRQANRIAIKSIELSGIQK